MLRPYQVEGRRKIVESYNAGSRSICVVAPTGSGKTVLISDIARGHEAKGGSPLITVHRHPLIPQTIAKLKAAGVDNVSVIAPGYTESPGAKVRIATIQSLLCRGELPDASMLLMDEAHHYVADAWGAVAAKYAHALRIGFTATPERSDGTPLGDLFDSLVVIATIPELTALGHLVPCDVIAPPRQTRTLAWDPVDAWFEHAFNRPTVVFAGGCEDGKLLADRFNGRGIAAGYVDGDTPAEERDATLAAFAAGELRIVVNIFVLTEGWDCPSSEVCMIARGCSHAGTFLQMVGRVLRPFPGKDRALLLDLRGVVHEHGLPDESRSFSLEGRAISGGEAPVKTCPVCSHVCAIACRVCPTCDAEFAFDTTEDRCALVKITKAEVERGFFVSQLEEATRRGYKPGFAAHRFQEKFGRFPAKYWREFVSRRAA